MRHHLARILIALSVFAAAPVMAAGSASATISGFSVRLVDLDLTDGITPHISFEPGSAFFDDDDYDERRAAQAFASVIDSFGFDSDVNTSLTFSPISSSASLAGANASAAISGNGTLPGTTLSASATTPDLVAGALTRFVASSGGSGISSIFMLSGNTLAIFTAQAFASISGAGKSEQGQSGLFFGDQAEVEAEIYVTGPGALGSEGGYQESSDEFELSSFGFDERVPPFDFSGTAELSATFLNLTGGNLSGQLDFDVYTDVATSTAPVPEPGTYALLLAGLGMMGFVAGRRRN